MCAVRKWQGPSAQKLSSMPMRSRSVDKSRGADGVEPAQSPDAPRKVIASIPNPRRALLRLAHHDLSARWPERLCNGRVHCSKASVLVGSSASSTARCGPSTRCVLWPGAPAARAQARRSDDFSLQLRVGCLELTLPTCDAPAAVCATGWPPMRGSWRVPCLLYELGTGRSVSCDETAAREREPLPRAIPSVFAADVRKESRCKHVCCVKVCGRVVSEMVPNTLY